MQFKQLASAILLSGAVSAQNLSSVLSSNGNLSALAGLLGQYPDLANTLGAANNVTLLAPSNQALSTFLNSTNSSALTAGAVTALLQYHVLNGTYNSSFFTNVSTPVRTYLNNATYANVTNGQRLISRLVGGNVTLFSGLDNPSVVTQANVAFSGGVVHIIDRVLTIPPRLSTALIAANLTALYGALNATNLLTTAGNLRDITVFAPNNAAFQAIGSALNNASTMAASSLLTYHVINGTRPYYTTQLTNGTSLQTLNGANVTVRISGNNTFVNGARVVRTNFLVGGGVVHIIDNVLNPANSTASADPSATTGAPAFSGATSVTTVPYTGGVTTPTSTLAGGSSPTTTTSSAGGVPRMTGAVGVAALFGAGAMVFGQM